MRQEKTREVIADSFYGLLKAHPFHRITVHMICDVSGVSKATFYRNYADKYDVMNSFFRIRCDRMLAENPGTGNCLNFLKEYSGLIVSFKDYFKALLTTDGQNSFWDYLFECGMSYYIENIERDTGVPISDEMRIQITIFTSGTVYLTRKWVEGKIDVPENEIADIVFRSMPDGMKKYFQGDQGTVL